jgi:hypothetical protein
VGGSAVLGLEMLREEVGGGLWGGPRRGAAAWQERGEGGEAGGRWWRRLALRWGALGGLEGRGHDFRGCAGAGSWVLGSGA